MQAIVLCGGKGERLKPLTESVPKPLVPIKGTPILSYIISHLAKFNVSEFLVASGYKAEKIDEYIEGSSFKDKMKTINSGDVDILQRLKDIREHINEDFLVVYGDTLTDVNIDDLKKFHDKSPGRVSVTLWRMKSPFGVLEVGDDGIVNSYEEKPRLDKWINIGYFYFDKDVINEIDGFTTFEDFLTHLVAKKWLNGFKYEGVHITVNTQKELTEAEDAVGELSLG